MEGGGGGDCTCAQGWLPAARGGLCPAPRGCEGGGVRRWVAHLQPRRNPLPPWQRSAGRAGGRWHPAARKGPAVCVGKRSPKSEGRWHPTKLTRCLRGVHAVWEGERGGGRGAGGSTLLGVGWGGGTSGGGRGWGGVGEPVEMAGGARDACGEGPAWESGTRAAAQMMVTVCCWLD